MYVVCSSRCVDQSAFGLVLQHTYDESHLINPVELPCCRLRERCVERERCSDASGRQLSGGHTMFHIVRAAVEQMHRSTSRGGYIYLRSFKTHEEDVPATPGGTRACAQAPKTSHLQTMYENSDERVSWREDRKQSSCELW